MGALSLHLAEGDLLAGAKRYRKHLIDAGTTLTIRDQGPGVKPEQLKSLFDPFYRGDPGNGHGYGLGLAIAKRAVLAHGGTITAANGAGEGLIITIWLPGAPDSPEGGDVLRSAGDRGVALQPVQAG